MSEQIAREWLKAAMLDMDSIRYILKAEHLTPVVAFHAQQAIEKTLKAILEFKNINTPKVHKLQTLLDLADVSIEIDEDLILVLDDLYIESRYPGDFGLLPDGKPTLEDAREFYETAEKMFDHVCKLIGIDKKKI